MVVQPYLFFEGRCEEAIEFYRKALGGEVTMLMRNKDSPQPPPAGSGMAAHPDKVMHATLRIGSTDLMASDGNCSGKPVFNGISLSLTVASEPEAKRMFDALAAGGSVHMPLTKTFFSPSFGMVADQFGVSWMVYVHA